MSKNCFIRKIAVVSCMMISLLPAAGMAGSEVKYTKEYSVEEAYAFFGHERTKYDVKLTKLAPQDAKYLDHLFFVTDKAMQARVNMMQYYFSGTDKKHIRDYDEKIESLLSSFDMVTPPSEDVKKAQDMIIDAIRDHQEFFKEWSSLKGNAYRQMKKNYTKHILVEASHIKLQRAYTQLMLVYPDEDKYNLQAFYNHLCALDFI